MAIVDHISKEMVKALSGYIDFYYWKGIPVARKWPDWHNFKMSEGQKASSAVFSHSRKVIHSFSEKLRERYRLMTIGKRKAWLDSVTGAYMSYWKITGSEPSTVIDYELFSNSPTYTLKVWTSGPDCPSVVFVSGPLTIPVARRCVKGVPCSCYGPPVGSEITMEMTKKEYDIEYRVQNGGYTNGGRSLWIYYRMTLEIAVNEAWDRWLLGQGRAHGAMNTMEWVVKGQRRRYPPYSARVSGNWVSWQYHMLHWRYFYPGVEIEKCKFVVNNSNTYDRGTRLDVPDISLNFAVPPGVTEEFFDPPEAWQTAGSPYVKFMPDESVTHFMPGDYYGGRWYAEAGFTSGCPQLWFYAGSKDYCEVTFDKSILPTDVPVYFYFVDSAGIPLPGPPIRFVVD